VPGAPETPEARAGWQTARLARRREQELGRERARQERERQRMEAELAARRRQEQIAAERQAEQEWARVAALREASMVAEREAARQQHCDLAVAEKPAPQQLTGRNPEPALPLARRRRGALLILRRIVATAFGAGLLLLLGFVAYSNRRPASPLSPGALMMSTSVKQEVPFGPVTITPPAAAPKPSSVAAVPKSSLVRPTARVPRRKPLHPASAARLKRDSDTE